MRRLICQSLVVSLFAVTVSAQQRQPAQQTQQPPAPTRQIRNRLQPTDVHPAVSKQAGYDSVRMKATDDSKNADIEKSIERYLITFDYNSWFEKINIVNTSTLAEQESQALYYGFGIGLEKNWYMATWGYGFGASVLGGSAVGGDKAGTLTYFQARVPWTAFKVTPRVFYRWTPRTDFGVDLAIIYKQGKWPAGDTNELQVTSGSAIIGGGFADMRVRFNPKLEMIQSFGMVYKDQSIFWRLGLAYRL